MKTTKELARELGLLRRRTLSSSSAALGIQTGQQSRQQWDYLVVIDFESTCWQEGKFRTQEVIEFPAVLLNTKTGEIESEFHHYVQPQESPTLSHFCTELTGITQDQVDGGIPINLCLKRFSRWLDHLHRDTGLVCNGPDTDIVSPRATCVTWSDWDLGVCLQYECKRKQILKPAQLNSWIDLRATYRKFYERKPNGLNGALQDLGIEFEGRQHSGLDDARNTAKLAWRMVRDGCQLKVTKSLKEVNGKQKGDATIAQYFRPSSSVAQTPSAVQGKSQQTSKLPKKSATPSKIPRPQTKPGVPWSIHADPSPDQTQATSVTVDRRNKSLCDKPQKSGLKVCETNVDHGSPVRIPIKKRGRDSPMKTPVKCGNQCVFKRPSPVGKTDFINKVVQNVMEEEFNFKTPSPVSKRRRTVTGQQSPGDPSKQVAGKVTLRVPSSYSGNGHNQSAATPVTNSTPHQGTLRVPASLRTPSLPAQRQSCIKTPVSGYSTPVPSTGSTAASAMKVTPPLCSCGRRSKRRMTQSPGPNFGRFFFTCATRHGPASRQGCEFFKWESSVSSVRNKSCLTKQFTPVVNVARNGQTQSVALSQRKSLGVRVVQSTGITCLR